MTRIQLACIVLIASACVLAGLLAATWANRPDRQADITDAVASTFESSAYGQFVVSKGGLTILATQVDTDHDMIYVLDSRSQRLVAYLFDPNRKEIERLAGLDIGEVMARQTKSGSRRSSGGGGRVDR